MALSSKKLTNNPRSFNRSDKRFVNGQTLCVLGTMFGFVTFKQKTDLRCKIQ